MGRSDDPTAGQLPALDHDRGRELAAPLANRPDRPVPDPPAGPDTDIEETLSALTDLIRRGRSARSGRPRCPRPTSSRPSGRPSGAASPFRSEQPPYSILDRGIEAEVLPVAERYGMGAWCGARSPRGCSPAGPQGRSRPTCAARGCFRHMRDERRSDAVEQIIPLADKAGLPMTHLAIAFAHRSPRRTMRDHRAAHDGAAR